MFLSDGTAAGLISSTYAKNKLNEVIPVHLEVQCGQAESSMIRFSFVVLIAAFVAQAGSRTVLPLVPRHVVRFLNLRNSHIFKKLCSKAIF